MSRTANVVSEPAFFILLALADGPKHGYAILKEVETLSNDRIQLGTGTLYGGLKRMCEAGWVEPSGDPADDENNRSRRTYRLTSEGRRATAEEAARLQSVATISREILGEMG